MSHRHVNRPIASKPVKLAEGVYFRLKSAAQGIQLFDQRKAIERAEFVAAYTKALQAASLNVDANYRLDDATLTATQQILPSGK